MFTTSTDHFSSAAKSQMESQFAIMNSFTDTFLTNTEKMVDLTLETLKSTLQDSFNNVHQLVSTQNPQEFFSLAAAQTKPRAEKLAVFSQQVSSIAANSQAELSKLTQEQVSNSTQKVSALVEEVSKQAPASMENVGKLMQSVIGNASASYAQMAKTAQQGADAMRSNLDEMARTAKDSTDAMQSGANKMVKTVQEGADIAQSGVGDMVRTARDGADAMHANISQHQVTPQGMAQNTPEKGQTPQSFSNPHNKK
jgi:phasin family protein